jgi:hypothetical protein
MNNNIMSIDLNLETEMERELDMIKSDFLYRLDDYSNYGSSGYFRDIKDDDNHLVDFIHNNYEKLSDEDLKSILTKILDIKQVKKFVLLYDLLNHTPIKDNNLDLFSFKKIIDNYLNRYTHRAGGFNLEDNTWRCSFNAYEKKLSYLNTVSKLDYDIETRSFIKILCDKLNSYTDHYKLVYKKKDTEGDNIVYVKLELVSSNNPKPIDILTDKS